jgi:ubiquitin-protein ligase
MVIRRIGKAVGVSALFITFVVASSTQGKNPSSVVVPAATKASVASENAVVAPNSRHEISGEDESSNENLPQATTKTKQKKQRNGKTVAKQKPTNSRATKTSPSSQASTSLRRIKTEYKDAVLMGIAYDWVRGKLVKPSSKTVATNSNTRTENDIMCIGPLTTNLRHWHFSFRGCGIYEAGVYHGRILLPKDYPATPPRVQLWTPSGRFIPYADICLSASAYHPESWTPRWTVQSLVQALRLHMLTNPQEIGGMTSTVEETLEYARNSLVWKLTWRAGKTLITVDHARLLQQEVLTIDSNEEDVEPVIQRPDDPVSSINPESEHSHLSGNEVVPSEDDSLLEPALSDPIHKGVHTTETAPFLAGRSAHISPSMPKRRKKTETSQKSKQQGGVATMKRRAPQKVREEKSQLIRSIVLGISKVFASRTRVSIFSLVLLFWILLIP